MEKKECILNLEHVWKFSFQKEFVETNVKDKTQKTKKVWWKKLSIKQEPFNNTEELLTNNPDYHIKEDENGIVCVMKKATITLHFNSGKIQKLHFESDSDMNQYIKETLTPYFINNKEKMLMFD